MQQDRLETDGIFTKRFFDFVKKLNVTPQNTIVENTLDKEVTLVSKYYTPRKALSQLAVSTLEDIKLNKIVFTRNKQDKDTLPGMVFNSDILKEYEVLTMYFRIILLETFSLVYAVKYRPLYRQYVDETDIKNVRETINYIVDILGFDPRYKDIIMALQYLEVDLGYIQAQAKLIRGGKV